MVFLSACQPSLLNPPRLAEPTADPALIPTEEPLFIPAPTPTGPPIEPLAAVEDEPVQNPIFTVWVNETAPEYAAVLEEMTLELDENHNLHIEYMLVENDRLPDLVSSAVLSGTLPDVIIHPVEYTLGWTQSGIFSPELSHRLVNILSATTFDQAALEKISENGTNLYAALPIDGALQIIVYRQDWFDSLGLQPPDTFDRFLTAAESIYNSEELSAQSGITSTLLSGLVVPTESDLVSTHQTFEQLASANGCRLIDEKGEVLILTPACRETLEFYRDLVNRLSPSDVQTDISAINAYLAGRTGMIFTSPSTLVYIAGLSSDYRPQCPECLADPNYLLNNSSVLTALAGEGEAARFGNMTMMGITNSADEELATRFASYWFNEGYDRWLSVQPERRVPLRSGPPEDPSQFDELWFDLPLAGGQETISDIFGAEVATSLSTGIADSPRWGIDSGHGTLMATIFESNLFAIVLQEMLSGYFTSNQASIEAYQRVVDLVPNYAYRIDISELSFDEENGEVDAP